MAGGNSTRGGFRRPGILSAVMGLLFGALPAISEQLPVPQGRSRRRARPIERRDRSMPKRFGQYEKRYRSYGSQRNGAKSNSPRGRSW